MAFDPNNPPGFEDEDIPAVKGAAGDAALLDLNSPANEDIPLAAQGEGGPYGIMECNMAPDLDDEANIASDPDYRYQTRLEGNDMHNVLPLDILFIVEERDYPKFKRDENNLIYTHKISLAEALRACNLQSRTKPDYSCEVCCKKAIMSMRLDRP
ncbi:hypothetical protein PR202_gb25025 [Eleusine coracana subsp. coracana]|uniref:Chaperone DnaJ C-terminal domain-containing protein n=1 Tax=Eleusine coracana subsp. coracana TaxID=191504 RepID=A0AAV5FN73_ELECO|nr:hypothetical protein PR202_gb25025 [Eleusine coracana subsp. coracana]